MENTASSHCLDILTDKDNNNEPVYEEIIDEGGVSKNAETVNTTLNSAL